MPSSRSRLAKAGTVLQRPVASLRFAVLEQQASGQHVIRCASNRQRIAAPVEARKAHGVGVATGHFFFMQFGRVGRRGAGHQRAFDKGTPVVAWAANLPLT